MPGYLSDIAAHPRDDGSILFAMHVCDSAIGCEIVITMASTVFTIVANMGESCCNACLDQLSKARVVCCLRHTAQAF